MTDQPASGGTASNPISSVPGPVAPAQVQVPAGQAANPPGAPNSAGSNSHSQKNQSNNILSRLTINEWVTLFLSFCSLVVSYFTYRNSADTSDLQKAVGNLATLVSETHRQADAAQGQLNLMSRQVAAAFEALAAAKRSADAASHQADIAQQALIASTRARLKITGISAAYVTRAAGAGLVWFNFRPTYKNFGPSPAEDITFNPHIFVIGAGDSPKGICEKDKTMPSDFFTSIVFPQEQGGVAVSGTQVSLQELGRQAAEVHAVQPSAAVYLGVVGCLTYKSGNNGQASVTGFVAGLHFAAPKRSKQRKYVPLYDILIGPGNSTKIEMEIKIENAWAE